MNPELIRILIILSLLASVVFAKIILDLRYKRLMATRSIQGIQPHRPSVILFTSPNCAPCDKVQKPILSRLLEKLPEPPQYFEINTQHSPEVAKEWGVLSVPSTFLLDRDGVTKFVHHGIVTEKTLSQQIKELS